MSQEHHTSVKKLRQTLRENAFEEWTRCKWQGIGAQHFGDAPKLNKFLFDKRILTGSEWINAIKLNSNYAPLRGVPGAGGQMVGEVGTLCRKCDLCNNYNFSFKQFSCGEILLSAHIGNSFLLEYHFSTMYYLMPPLDRTGPARVDGRKLHTEKA
uniref:Uncharacterized protein n=1 Tax=Rhodnius prolixus TaxID=13249 RepID=T1HL97_RHOPR